MFEYVTMRSSHTMGDYTLLLYKIGDFGPQILYKEPMPIRSLENDESIIMELGLYISLVISQGKGLNAEGFAGPIPWHNSPDHEIMVYSFLAKSDVIDPRKKRDGVMHFLIIIHERQDEVFIQSKLALKNELDNQLKSTLVWSSIKTINANLKFVRELIDETIASGLKIVQEKAFDELLTHKSVRDICIYSNSLNLELLFKGQKENLPSITQLQDWNDVKSRIILSPQNKELSAILLKYNEYYFYLSFQSSSLNEAIEVINKANVSFEIISSYI